MQSLMVTRRYHRTLQSELLMLTGGYPMTLGGGRWLIDWAPWYSLGNGRIEKVKREGFILIRLLLFRNHHKPRYLNLFQADRVA